MTARPAPDKALLDELRALYAELDALYAGVSCPGSTECCRFGVTGRQPYLTAIELALVQHALAARGGATRTPRKRPLPLAADREERACPLLDGGARCSVYEARPFGCRTFYCERATGPLPKRKQVQELLRRLQALAARHRLGGELARPIERALASEG